MRVYESAGYLSVAEAFRDGDNAPNMQRYMSYHNLLWPVLSITKTAARFRVQLQVHGHTKFLLVKPDALVFLSYLKLDGQLAANVLRCARKAAPNRCLPNNHEPVTQIAIGSHVYVG